MPRNQGARVVSWNGARIDEAVASQTLPRTHTTPATAEGQILAPYKLLPRAPVGTRLEVEAWNPDDAGPRPFALTAEDDAMKALELSDPRPRLDM